MNWENLPDSSRVWIYQSNRFLSSEECLLIQEKGRDFVNSWNSHGSELEASIEVFNDLHVVVLVNEAHHGASGCSIDKSVHWIQQLEKELTIDFFDRMLCAVKIGEELELVPASKLSGQHQNALMYDNLITTKEELISTWIKPIDTTWAKNFLN